MTYKRSYLYRAVFVNASGGIPHTRNVLIIIIEYIMHISDLAQYMTGYHFQVQRTNLMLTTQTDDTNSCCFSCENSRDVAHVSACFMLISVKKTREV